MANWTGIWDEAEQALENLLGEYLDGAQHSDELPDILPTEQDCMYVIDFHGGGTAIEPDSENYETKGSDVGSAVEKQVDATIIAIATSKRRARKFAESLWNALPQAPSARPLARVWVSVEPDIQRGVWKAQNIAGNEAKVYMINATISVMLCKSDTW